MPYRIRKPHAPGRIQSRINITPLIDILLVLIVIFMVVTPMTPTGLEAQIPRQTPTPETKPNPAPTTLVLQVDQNGVLTLNRSRVNSIAELVSELQDLFKTRNDRTIFIQGSSELKFDSIAQIIDAAHGGGANRIGLMTEEIH